MCVEAKEHKVKAHVQCDQNISTHTVHSVIVGTLLRERNKFQTEYILFSIPDQGTL